MDFKNMGAKKVCGFQGWLRTSIEEPRILGWRVYRSKFDQVVPRQDGKRLIVLYYKASVTGV